MAGLIASSKIAVIVGTGVSARAVARFFEQQGTAYLFMDTRACPPELDSLRQQFPHAAVELGGLDEDCLVHASQIVISPGLSIKTTEIQAAIAAGVPVVGDVALFLEANQAPVIAITGSNAKSTVTTLVGEMAKQAKLSVAVAGNIGTPVLDLLVSEQAYDLVVLELSSFQLETIEKVGAKVATVLNMSADHVDRYAGLPQYHMAKQRVYFGAENVVINRQDPLTRPPLADGVTGYSFGLNRPDRNGFGLINNSKGEQLAYEFKALMPVSEIKMTGRHNVENALSALALGHAAGLPLEAMLQALREFSGLPHRCQWLATKAGVDYYNDSKGTNVGATLAALNGLEKENSKVILIAGGVGKGADFTPLADALNKVRALVLIGEDAEQIAVLAGDVPVEFASDMHDAVMKAQAHALSGDDVLLSPACASFDMFSGFEARGDAFAQAVEALSS